MKLKILAIICSSSFFAAQVAHAVPLTISNNTNHNLVFAVNGLCTAKVGTVPRYQIVTVPSSKLADACGTEDECLIQAYENTCNGVYAGGVVYNKVNPGVFPDNGDDLSVSLMVSVSSTYLNLFYNQHA